MNSTKLSKGFFFCSFVLVQSVLELKLVSTFYFILACEDVGLDLTPPPSFQNDATCLSLILVSVNDKKIM